MWRRAGRGSVVMPTDLHRRPKENHSVGVLVREENRRSVHPSVTGPNGCGFQLLDMDDGRVRHERWQGLYIMYLWLLRFASLLFSSFVSGHDSELE